MSSDLDIQRAIEAGTLNQEAKELIQNWCAHARVTAAARRASRHAGRGHTAWRTAPGSLMTTAARWPASPLPQNNHAFLLCAAAHNRKNWLFAGTLAAGKRAAAITSLIQSVKLNGHDPYAYLKDILERLPTQRASEIGQLLPHRWSPRS